MKYMKTIYTLFIFLTMVSNSTEAQESTEVTVRAIAKDAKFIGSSMGGVIITIKNAETGEVLAEGLTEGSTGSTEKLVLNPKKRYEQLHTEGSARFSADLNLDEPVFVTIAATSTYRNEKEVTSSTQLWLIPGMDITGDGIILEIPGFLVDITNLQPYENRAPGIGINVKAKIVMMCGCPTEPGGEWDSSEFTIKAVVKEGGEVIQIVPLEFSGEQSIYTGSFTTHPPGSYKVLVYAFDPRTENSGVDFETIQLQ